MALGSFTASVEFSLHGEIDLYEATTLSGWVGQLKRASGAPPHGSSISSFEFLAVAA